MPGGALWDVTAKSQVLYTRVRPGAGPKSRPPIWKEGSIKINAGRIILCGDRGFEIERETLTLLMLEQLRGGDETLVKEWHVMPEQPILSPRSQARQQTCPGSQKPVSQQPLRPPAKAQPSQTIAQPFKKPRTVPRKPLLLPTLQPPPEPETPIWPEGNTRVFSSGCGRPVGDISTEGNTRDFLSGCGRPVGQNFELAPVKGRSTVTPLEVVTSVAVTTPDFWDDCVAGDAASVESERPKGRNVDLWGLCVRMVEEVERNQSFWDGGPDSEEELHGFPFFEASEREDFGPWQVNQNVPMVSPNPCRSAPRTSAPTPRNADGIYPVASSAGAVVDSNGRAEVGHHLLCSAGMDSNSFVGKPVVNPSLLHKNSSDLVSSNTGTSQKNKDKVSEPVVVPISESSGPATMIFSPRKLLTNPSSQTKGSSAPPAQFGPEQKTANLAQCHAASSLQFAGPKKKRLRRISHGSTPPQLYDGVESGEQFTDGKGVVANAPTVVEEGSSSTPLEMEMDMPTDNSPPLAKGTSALPVVSENRECSGINDQRDHSNGPAQNQSFAHGSPGRNDQRDHRAGLAQKQADFNDQVDTPAGLHNQQVRPVAGHGVYPVGGGLGRPPEERHNGVPAENSNRGGIDQTRNSGSTMGLASAAVDTCGKKQTGKTNPSGYPAGNQPTLTGGPVVRGAGVNGQTGQNNPCGSSTTGTTVGGHGGNSKSDHGFLAPIHPTCAGKPVVRGPSQTTTGKLQGVVQPISHAESEGARNSSARGNYQNSSTGDFPADCRSSAGGDCRNTFSSTHVPLSTSGDPARAFPASSGDLGSRSDSAQADYTRNCQDSLGGPFMGGQQTSHGQQQSLVEPAGENCRSSASAIPGGTAGISQRSSSANPVVSFPASSSFHGRPNVSSAPTVPYTRSGPNGMGGPLGGRPHIHCQQGMYAAGSDGNCRSSAAGHSRSTHSEPRERDGTHAPLCTSGNPVGAFPAPPFHRGRPNDSAQPDYTRSGSGQDCFGGSSLPGQQTSWGQRQSYVGPGLRVDSAVNCRSSASGMTGIQSTPFPEWEVAARNCQNGNLGNPAGAFPVYHGRPDSSSRTGYNGQNASRQGDHGRLDNSSQAGCTVQNAPLGGHSAFHDPGRPNNLSQSGCTGQNASLSGQPAFHGHIGSSLNAATEGAQPSSIDLPVGQGSCANPAEAFPVQPSHMPPLADLFAGCPLNEGRPQIPRSLVSASRCVPDDDEQTESGDEGPVAVGGPCKVVAAAAAFATAQCQVAAASSHHTHADLIPLAQAQTTPDYEVPCVPGGLGSSEQEGVVPKPAAKSKAVGRSRAEKSGGTKLEQPQRPRGASPGAKRRATPAQEVLILPLQFEETGTALACEEASSDPGQIPAFASVGSYANYYAQQLLREAQSKLDELALWWNACGGFPRAPLPPEISVVVRGVMVGAGNDGPGTVTLLLGNNAKVALGNLGACSRGDVWVVMLSGDRGGPAGSPMLMRALWRGINPKGRMLCSVVSHNASTWLEGMGGRGPKLIPATAIAIGTLACEFAQLECLRGWASDCNGGEESGDADTAALATVLAVGERSGNIAKPPPPLPPEVGRKPEIAILNTEQSLCVREVGSWASDTDLLRPPSSGIVLLKGVFGSGKSRTLAACIYALDKMLAERRDHRRIMLVCQTNVAVDAVLHTLIARYGWDDFARLGSFKSVDSTFLYRTVSLMATRQASAQELSDALSRASPELRASLQPAIDRGVLPPRTNTWKKRRLVATTAAALASADHFSSENLKCTLVLVDEATQLTEPTVFSALRRSGVRRLLVVGDPKQLPPRANAPGLKCSILERLWLHNPAAIKIELATQYRCHPDIAELGSSLFYGGCLKHGVGAEDRTSILGPGVPPTMVVLSSGTESRVSRSYCHDAEASWVAKWLRYLVDRCNLPEKDVGVICMYKPHAQACARAVASIGLGAVQVATVDAFQGAEKDVILLSFGRSSPTSGRDQFGACPRRLNVALSRGKRHLMIVGGEVFLSQHPQLTPFLASARQKGAVHHGTTLLSQAFSGPAVRC